LVIAINRDEVLSSARLDAENWREAAEDAQEELESAKAWIAAQEKVAEGMVPGADYQELYQTNDSNVARINGLQKELANAQVHSADCLEAMEGMVPREEYEGVAVALATRNGDVARLQKELEDARAELEALRAEGSEEAGGSEESTERESG